jgi:hypothetical protein
MLLDGASALPANSENTWAPFSFNSPVVSPAFSSIDFVLPGLARPLVRGTTQACSNPQGAVN